MRIIRLRSAFATADLGSAERGNRRSACRYEASCATRWFLQLMEELGMECCVGHVGGLRLDVRIEQQLGACFDLIRHIHRQ